MLPRFPHVFIAGDVLPVIAVEYEEQDLSGHTITLRVQRPSDVLEVPATAVDLGAGLFTFQWSAGNLVAGLGQVAEIRIVDPLGKQLTAPRFTIDVEKAL